MKKSLYRQVMFTISIIILILCLLISFKLNIFDGLKNVRLLSILLTIFSSPYVSGILCSIIAVVIIYIIQLNYSKSMLKKDFRCNEIIEDLYNAIEEYSKLIDEIPEKTKLLPDEDFNDKKNKEALLYYEFYKKYYHKLHHIAYALSYENNNILIESVQSCFFINLNFKLLNIVNNIKNRIPNIKNKYPKIEDLYWSYEKDKKTETLLDLYNYLPIYFIDLRFLAIYWKHLIDYLKYDPTYIKTFITIYNSKYDIFKDLELSKEELAKRNKEIGRIVKKELLKHKLKNFWNK